MGVHAWGCWGARGAAWPRRSAMRWPGGDGMRGRARAQPAATAVTGKNCRRAHTCIVPARARANAAPVWACRGGRPRARRRRGAVQPQVTAARGGGGSGGGGREPAAAARARRAQQLRRGHLLAQLRQRALRGRARRGRGRQHHVVALAPWGAACRSAPGRCRSRPSSERPRRQRRPRPAHLRRRQQRPELQGRARRRQGRRPGRDLRGVRGWGPRKRGPAPSLGDRCLTDPALRAPRPPPAASRYVPGSASGAPGRRWCAGQARRGPPWRESVAAR
jgi:hypothetical protein